MIDVGDVVSNCSTSFVTVTLSVIVSTFAGSGSATPFSDGQGSAASFYNPRAIAVDSNGTVYIADTSNHRIRKITPKGLVSTFAGSSSNTPFSNGQGSAATFNYPSGIAVDSNGIVYVGDTSYNRIRKITPGGLVSTLAGSDTASFSDGQGSAARFYSPAGVAVDSNGTVYVADTSNHRIRKITPEGLVSTLAGTSRSCSSGPFSNGQGTAATFCNPAGIAVDSNGMVYVADTGYLRIRKITPDGLVSTLAGSSSYTPFSNGQGSAATFYNPAGIAVDSIGTVYVADTYSYRIRMITPGGLVSTLAGSGSNTPFANGQGAIASFHTPMGIAIDSNGTFYIADTNNRKIRKIQNQV